MRERRGRAAVHLRQRGRHQYPFQIRQDPTANFIVAGTFTTGIACEGTDFYISLPTASPRAIRKYSGTTGALLQTITLAGLEQIEDLSADYAVVIGPTTPTQIPTMSEWALVVLAALLAVSAFFFLRRRSR